MTFLLPAFLVVAFGVGLAALLVYNRSAFRDGGQSESTESAEVDVNVEHFEEMDEDELREEAEDLVELATELNTERDELAATVEDLEAENEALREERDDALDKVDEFHDRVDPDGAIELEPPHMQTSTFGVVEDLLREWRHRQKEQKLARKGYVKWRLVKRGSLSRPKYVKPKQNGDGVPEFTYGGNKYLFHRDAMVTSSSSGMWTCFHKEGEMDPIPVNDPLMPGIPADTVDEWLTMSVTSSPPGVLDRFDLDARDALTYSMAAIIILAGFQQVM